MKNEEFANSIFELFGDKKLASSFLYSASALPKKTKQKKSVRKTKMNYKEKKTFDREMEELFGKGVWKC